jgi:hypothetical protein
MDKRRYVKKIGDKICIIENNIYAIGLGQNINANKIHTEPHGFIIHDECFWVVRKGNIAGVSIDSLEELDSLNIENIKSILLYNPSIDNKVVIIGEHCKSCKDSVATDIDMLFYTHVNAEIAVINDGVYWTINSYFPRRIFRFREGRRTNLAELLNEKFVLGRSRFRCNSCNWHILRTKLKEDIRRTKKQWMKYQDKVILGGLQGFKEYGIDRYWKVEPLEPPISGKMITIEVSILSNDDTVISYISESNRQEIDKVVIPKSLIPGQFSFYNYEKMIRHISRYSFLTENNEFKIPETVFLYLKKRPDYLRTKIEDIPYYKWAVNKFIQLAKERHTKCNQCQYTERR